MFTVGLKEEPSKKNKGHLYFTKEETHGGKPSPTQVHLVKQVYCFIA
jgi:hypothetical protein